MILQSEDKVKIPAPAQETEAAAQQKTTQATQSTQTQTAQTQAADAGTVTAPAVETPRTEQPKASNYASTMEALRRAQYTTPSFASSYDEEISNLYSQIINRKPFSYSASEDPLYQQYRDQYMQQGQQAMRDTMGQAAGLTGGYGSTYSQAAGQQAYEAYLARMNEVLPELYGQAYSRWADEGNRLTTNLSLAGALRSTDYDQFRDEIGDLRYAQAQAIQEAEARAQYGDFTGYADLFGEEAARRMLMSWAAANPQAAYTNGDITAEEFFNLTGQYPIGYLGAGAGAAAGGGGWMPQGKQGIKTAQENMNQILVSNGYSPIQTDGFNGPETQKAAALVDKILAGEGV